MRIFCLIFAVCLLPSLSSATAREIYIDNLTGNDQHAGTADAPLRSARRGAMMAAAGDTIHLLPKGSVYREMITLADKRDLTIEGHDCIVSGADPLPFDPAAWEKVSEGLHRIRLKRTTQDRHILIVDGKGITMGRTKYQINPLASIQRRDGFEAFQPTLRAQYPQISLNKPKKTA